MRTHEAKHLSTTIARDLQGAYEALWHPESFARWASGLASSLQDLEGNWIAETPEGRARVRFSPKNAHGVLDHWVDPPGSSTIYIPLRLIANGDGCELVLTLFRQPGMSDEKFEADAAWVVKDLASAKRMLEQA